MQQTLFRLLKNKFYLLKSYIKQCNSGTADWLVAAEIKYGGMIENVPRNKVSPFDPRTKKQLKIGGMVGGDRMLFHGYAKKYEEYLKYYLTKNKKVSLIEVGILKGTGLAIWCDLFPKGNIIGLDIDLSHFEKNKNNLKYKGAFKFNYPSLYEFDQFADNTNLLKEMLNINNIDIIIDDGFHSNKTNLTTFKSFLPYLAKHFVYFIEDNRAVGRIIKKEYPQFKTEVSGDLVIIINC